MSAVSSKEANSSVQPTRRFVLLRQPTAEEASGRAPRIRRYWLASVAPRAGEPDVTALRLACELARLCTGR